jgi:hypothetical protein
LIRIPSIYLDYNNYDNSLQELKRRENEKSVDINVSTIFEKYRNKNIQLMLNKFHPTTFLFLEIMKELCLLMNIDFFTKRQYRFLLKNKNFMGLSK